ncbi:hypothetical protein C7C46_05440 [Streptomyces tateyamensis]|uniref:SnoaL-like domain-containing protein n=1 Tax=Streptomyces tateyamensis TaxID=565073 RepID=A0A2V4P9D6_9ACTN|nr:nuclear transport factor 2 family protein [Streptomyces tateyamensis]PYC86932.1 hypothetical protein C7C46_05440 [Streptomyces tateyamensis]
MTTTVETEVQQIKQYVADWYVALDNHVPWDEVTEYLVSEADGIRFIFPEVTVTDYAGLKNWYDTVTNRFFDEAHTVELSDVEAADGFYKVHVIVRWQTRIWNPPQPKSQALDFRADQSWEIVFVDGKPKLRTYDVTSFVPLGDTPELF